MNYPGLLDRKHCRWCSKVYYAKKPVGRDGCCKPSCKQALYRARKHYVTRKRRRSLVQKIS